MLRVGRDTVIKRMEEIERLLNRIDYDKLWSGFSKTKYAIYDDKNFCINDAEGIDMDLIETSSFYVGKVDERFIGNTAILLNDNYVAIWNMNTVTEDIENERLASLLVHEMFHCFQFVNGEKRFPNELLGINYPITIENVNLRTLERQYLLNANLEINREKKMDLITSYFNIRNKREKLIGDILEYEKAIESVEGVAAYIEFKALNQLNKDKEVSNLKEYTKGFIDVSEKNLKIRHSSYIQGLLLGLIADDYISSWKNRFMNNKSFLSNFIQEELDIKVEDIDYENENITQIEECVINWVNKINLIFDDFNKKSKSNILKEGFELTAFDPMNIVKRDNEIIHTNLLKLKVDDIEQIIKGPVKTTIGNHLFDIKKIEW